MTVGLGGTVTLDEISYESGPTYRGLGGILYQAAVLCGLGQEVNLYANLGQDLVADFEESVRHWPTLRRHGVYLVPGSGNRVHLYYPDYGERVEILESAVPPLELDYLLAEIPDLALFLMVFNSGFDLDKDDWKKFVKTASCPVWLDIHSLVLERRLGSPRRYRSFTAWEDWASGVRYLQANRREVAASLGHPDEEPTFEDMERFGWRAHELGIEAVFVTLGGDGVMVTTANGHRFMRPPQDATVMDTTGCGDVFGAAAASRLMDGRNPMEAAEFGLRLANEAAGVVGVEAVYALARRMKKDHIP